MSWRLAWLSLAFTGALVACESETDSAVERPIWNQGFDTAEVTEGAEAPRGVACGDHANLLGGTRELTVMDEARTYVLQLPGALPQEHALPLVMLFHGTGGNAATWHNSNEHMLVEAIGEGAIIVFPEALPGNDGLPQWRTDHGLAFFDSILQDLDGCFDPERVFASGHSSGGGMTHQLACERGEQLRGAAPVSGLMTRDPCVGQTAVFQIHGAEDELIPITTGSPARDYWARRNGCDLEMETASIHEQCISFAGCDEAYPTHW